MEESCLHVNDFEFCFLGAYSYKKHVHISTHGMHATNTCAHYAHALQAYRREQQNGAKHSGNLLYMKSV